MSVKILLIQRRYVYLAIAIVCLIGGLSIAVIYQYGASWAPHDFDGRVVVTTGGEPTENAHDSVVDVAVEDTQGTFLDPELEETLVAARVQYDYDGSSLAAARLSRDYARSREIDVLRESIERTSASGEASQEAQRRLLDLVSRMEAESSAESLIRASGFADAMVLVTGASVEAVVSSDGLGKEDVAVIGGILSRATGARLHEIRIREAVEASQGG